jgi:hypothetical protein
MTDLLRMLRQERAAVAHRLAALDTAIHALNGNHAPEKKKRTRKMSTAARAKISAAQKKRWVKLKK